MLGKDAMFMLEELRAARGDMEGEEGVSSIRWASGLLGRRRSLKTCLSSIVIVCLSLSLFVIVYHGHHQRVVDCCWHSLDCIGRYCHDLAIVSCHLCSTHPLSLSFKLLVVFVFGVFWCLFFLDLFYCHTMVS